MVTSSINSARYNKAGVHIWKGGKEKEKKILLFSFGATRPPLVSSFFVVL
jgi:hypothetical protein